MSSWMTLLTGGQMPDKSDKSDVAVLLVGTTHTCKQMRKLLHNNNLHHSPIGCVLLNSQQTDGVMGMPVLGVADDLPRIVQTHHFDLALVSLPAAMSKASECITLLLKELDITTRYMPTLEDQLSGCLGNVGSVDPAQLLQRPSHELDHKKIEQLLTGKRVMITGAGGSIGSHLSRIVASYKPSQLFLMDRAENNLFEIDRRMKTDFPKVLCKPMLHDVTDAAGTLELAQKYKPEVIFHAAAHKHVPMMEDHPRAAVKNNFFGTKSIVDAAVAVGAEKFVMISTDKAVNPSSIMGATKRFAELYVQSMDCKHGTQCSMVRFGNVLGSACSVVPIWTDQLSRGGPVTVTDPLMTRYFMTIPEAASLVIQAACLPGGGGQVFVLDMGEPIRIYDLAQRFIEMHSLEVGRDVEIVITGSRPGEKLYEELSYDSEDMLATEHGSVRIVKTSPPSESWSNQIVDQLAYLQHHGSGEEILALLTQSILPLSVCELVGKTPINKASSPSVEVA